jgi:hypothetical protein
MAEINLPTPKAGKDDKQTIQNLFDAFYRMKKDLDFALHNLSSENVTSLDANETTIQNISASSIWGAL